MAIIKNPVTVIQSGGGPTPIEPLDPYEVYANTRPSDWLEMPADEDMEDESLYFLLNIPDTHEGDYDCRFYCNMNYFNYTVNVEFGTVVNGSFVVDSTYSVMGGTPGSGNGIVLNIPTSMFIQVSNGQKQLIMRVIPAVSGYKFQGVRFIYNEMYSFSVAMVEAKIKSNNISELRLSNTTNPYESVALRYVTILGNYTEIGSGNQFSGCPHLQAVMAGRNGTLRLKNASNAFQSCLSLEAVPEISVTTTCSNMFIDCRELVTIPQLTIGSSVSNFTKMFSGCYNLAAVPLFDTSHGTNFSYMFSNCYSLETIPLFDTSAGTNFSYMFQQCNILKKVPAFDTSSGTNFSYMFQACRALKEVPTLDTSSGANFSYMFQYCYGLEEAPALETSAGTNFSYMFQSCVLLKYVPSFDTPLGTNFLSMFDGCVLLKEIPVLNTSSATTVQSMFSGCQSLENTDALYNMDFSSVPSYSTTGFLDAASLAGWANEYIYLPPASSAPSGGWGSNSLTIYASTHRTENPICIIIDDDSTMVPLAATGQQVFGNSSYSYYRNLFVFVPDSMYATYTADSNWANLGARLKKMSELPS